MNRIVETPVAPVEPRTSPSAQKSAHASAPGPAPSAPDAASAKTQITPEQQALLDDLLDNRFLAYPEKFRPEPSFFTTGAGAGLRAPSVRTFGQTSTVPNLAAGPVDVPGDPWNGKTWYVPVPVDAGDRAAVLTALGVTGLLLTVDGPIKEGVQGARTDFSDRVSAFIEPFGTEERLLPMAGGMALAGLVFRDRRAKDAIVAGMQSVLIAQGATEAVKAATGRIRPRNTDDPYAFGNPGNKSFFSGHSSASGAWWHTMAIHLRDNNHPKLAILAEIMGAAVPMSRVHDNAHWASDAFLGWAVGVFSAELVDRWRKGDQRGGGVLIVPSVDFEGNFRVNFTWQTGKRKPRPLECRKLPDGRDKVRACVQEAFARSQ